MPIIGSGGESLALGEEIGRRIAQHGGAALIIDYGDDHVHSSSLQVSNSAHKYTHTHMQTWRLICFNMFVGCRCSVSFRMDFESLLILTIHVFWACVSVSFTSTICYSPSFHPARTHFEPHSHLPFFGASAPPHPLFSSSHSPLIYSQGVKAHTYAHVLAEPGTVDLSSHVDFCALRNVAVAEREARVAAFGPITQSAFLQAMGMRVRQLMVIAL